MRAGGSKIVEEQTDTRREALEVKRGIANHSGASMSKRPTKAPSTPIPMLRRVGASRRSEIPLHVAKGLSDGALESATLAEGLAVDFKWLLTCAAPEVMPEEVARVRWVAPVDSLWNLPGRRSRKRPAREDRIASEPLVPRYTGRLQSEPTCATHSLNRGHPAREFPESSDCSSSLLLLCNPDIQSDVWATPPPRVFPVPSCCCTTQTLKAASGPPRLYSSL